ncbi:hematopoietic cell signal transducer isoform X2 [Pogona vitticeps]
MEEEAKAMWGFAVSIFCLVTGNYANCYHITTGTITGIVVGDIVLTVLLLIPVYYCIRPKDSRKSERTDYVNMIGKSI